MCLQPTMKPRSPTLEGFRLISRRPSFGFAEIAWRWSFGTTALALLAFSVAEYLDSLPVTKGDLFLLRTGQPFLIGRAILRIFSGSSLRVVKASLLMAIGLALIWILIAALGRAATLRPLLAYFQTGSAAAETDVKAPQFHFRALLGLNFLRVAAAFAAALGVLAAFVLADLASSAHNPVPVISFLVFWGVLAVVWLAWRIVNWFLALAAIFAVRDGQHSFAALAAAVDFFRDHSTSVLAAGVWFGLAHFLAFVLASAAAAFPLAFAGVIPPGFVAIGVALVTWLYFAMADFLYIGRLAAYVAICEAPELPAAQAATIAQPGPHPSFPKWGIDPDELILSDVPAS